MNEKGLKDITVFIDESGSIPNEPSEANRYFIITLLFVEDKSLEHLKKIYKKSRLKVAKRKEKLINKLREVGEIKGSEISEKNKSTIYLEIMEKCSEEFELAIIVLDSVEAIPRFRENSSRAFNYLIKVYLEKHFKYYSKYNRVNSMKFIIDERNVATGSKNTLKEYLNIELNSIESFSKEDIDVHYYDSKRYLLLQMTDFISNTFYRSIQKNMDDFGNVELLTKKTCKNKTFKFPL